MAINQEHKCNSCFYGESPRDMKPCITCQGYNKYVNRNVFINQPDTITIKTWDNDDAFVEWEKEQYMQNDVVNSPQHYTHGKFEVIDVIEDWDLNFRLANAVKYIARHKHKGKPLEDLQKALWYLQREVDTWKSPSKN